MTAQPPIEALLREHAPRALAALVRRYGDFDTCEDALQEALVAAAAQWPTDGVPANPAGWLVTVASRRLIELWRNASARRRREERAAPSRGSPSRASHATTRSRCSRCAATRP